MPRHQRDEAFDRIQRLASKEASDPYEGANPDATCPKCGHWKDQHGRLNRMGRGNLVGCSECDCDELWEDWPPYDDEGNPR